MGSLRTLAAVLLIAVATAYLHDADAVAYKEVKGVVADAAGEAVGSVMVTYGPRVLGVGGRTGTWTDAAGKYSLNISVADFPVVIHLTKDSIVPESQEVSILDEGNVDFAVTYQFFADVTPSFATALPHAFILKANTPLTPDKACVEAFDERTGQTSNLSPVSTPQGWRWESSLPMESGTPGIYRVIFVGKDCARGAPITRTLNRYYWFDEAAPTVSLVSPAEGHAYLNAVDGGPSADGSALVVGQTTLVAFAEDDSDLSHGGFRLENLDNGRVHLLEGRQHEFGTARSKTFERTFVGQGTYVVKAYVVDDVGSVSWSEPRTIRMNAGG